MADQWIIIPNWDKFQHYTDRSPVWIKVYTELNSKDEWLDLTLMERGLLVTVWLQYARSRGVLPVYRLVHTPDNRYGNVMRALHSLARAGFIEVSASRPLAQRREEKKKKEKENTRSLTNDLKPQPATPQGTNLTGSLDGANQHLTQHELGLSGCTHRGCQGLSRCQYELEL